MRILCTALTVILLACGGEKQYPLLSESADGLTFENHILRLRIDDNMHIRLVHKNDGRDMSLTRSGPDPFTLVVNGRELKDFTLDRARTEIIPLDSTWGKGQRLLISGRAAGPLDAEIEKTLSIDLYDAFPGAALLSARYKNINRVDGLYIDKEINNRFRLGDRPRDLWILQGGSYKTRPDWILPVTADFDYLNYQGPDYEHNEAGGGLPVLDVWSPQTGFMTGSIEKKPTLISLPARVKADSLLHVSIEYARDGPGFITDYKTISTVIAVHKGDFYNGLATYRGIMAGQGLKMIELSGDDPAYDAIWCGWGFGPEFTTERMIGMIPRLREWGIRVVTVDFGWFTANGDFDRPDPDIFPNGASDIRAFVKTFHDAGFRIKLWITPAVAGPDLMARHPEWLMKKRDGRFYKWEKFGQPFAFLCPAVDGVRGYYGELTRRIIGDWGFDGFKADQEIINAIGNCHNPEHEHPAPGVSFAELPGLYKIMADETFKIKPDAILEVCPCGMFPSFYKMPYYNQPLSSDFNSQWQIRHRAKVIKALMGPRAAYYGDHVERHYTPDYFASVLGVGGIPGTMAVNRAEDNYSVLRAKYPGYVSPQRQALFKKWFALYNRTTLSKGRYLNLYDLAWDKPEGHAIGKEGDIYYAFYADKWSGEVELRGLEDREYRVHDYVNDRLIATVKGPARVHVDFSAYLLLRATPVTPGE